MKHKKILALLLSLVMLFTLLTGCGGNQKDTNTAGNASNTENTASSTGTDSENQTEDTSVTVVDMMGRTVTLNEPARRVVALTASDCEILYAIGAGEMLVGRGEYCDYPAEVLDIPAVNSGAETNLEQIIALDPDVILMSSMAQAKEVVTALETAGIAVVVSDAKDIEGTYEAIGLIGALMGKDDNAAKIIDDMKSTFSAITDSSGGDGSKTVYFEVSPLQYGLWAAGTNTFMDEIAGMLGLTNAFADVDGFGAISEEQVLQRDPDYIVTISMYFGEGPTPVEEILSRAGWEHVTAVKNGAVLNLPNNELSRPAPRLAEGAEMMYDFIYGNK